MATVFSTFFCCTEYFILGAKDERVADRMRRTTQVSSVDRQRSSDRKTVDRLDLKRERNGRARLEPSARNRANFL